MLRRATNITRQPVQVEHLGHNSQLYRILDDNQVCIAFWVFMAHQCSSALCLVNRETKKKNAPKALLAVGVDR